MPDVLIAIWVFLSQFPVGLAQETTGVIIGANGIFAIMVMFKRTKLKISAPAQWAPMMLFAVAWLAGVVAEAIQAQANGWSWLWAIYSVLTLVSFSWSVVNIVRVFANR